MIGRTIGGYRIVEQVGMGGMATVYKAYDASTDRYVALKTLPEQYSKDPQFVERFRREARAIAKLEHLHILPLFAYGEDQGTAFLAMRYLPAGTLSNYIREKGQIPLEDSSRILNQIASALDHAHANGVLHRDIKPSNVLIDKDTNVYLTDFGIARMVEGTLDLTGDAILGTPQYMSPEQCQGRKDLTPASDQYSLGVVLYEMVTGRVPFQAETPLAVLIMQINGAELPLPTTLRPDLPDAVERVILKSLSRNPDDRYPSCEAMAKAFAQAIGENQPATKANIPAATRAAQPASLDDAPTTVQAPLSVTASPARSPIWIIGGVIAAIVVIGAIVLLTRPPAAPPVTPEVISLMMTATQNDAQIAAALTSTVVTATEASGLIATSATVKPTDVPTATPVIPTVAPSATEVPPTSTTAPPTATKVPPTSTTAPTATNVPPSATPAINGLPAIASTLIAQDDTGAAISLLSPAIDQTPKDAQLYLLRGQAYQKAGDQASAMTDFKQVLALAPDSADARVGLAYYYYSLNDTTSVIKELTDALKAQPNRADIYALRGQVFRGLNDLDQSLKDYDKAIELDPQNAQWHADRAVTQEYKGNVTAAIDDLTQAIALNPKFGGAYIQRGYDQRQLNQYDQAQADFLKAREINPQDVSSYSAAIENFIEVQNNGGSLKDYDLDAAFADANKALEIETSTAGLWYLRGRIYAYRNEQEAAISDYTQAIDLDNTYADAYVGRGYQYTNTGRYDDAHADFNKAIELNADNIDALQGRIEAYLEAVDNNKGWKDYDLDAALADAEKAVQDDTGNAISYLLRGKVYGRKGDTEKALADLNQTIQFAPQMAWGYLERGAVYHAAKKLGPAIIDFKKAIYLDPSDAWSYVQLGDALYDNNQKKEALDAYKSYAEKVGADQVIDYVRQRITELEKGT